MIDNGLGFQLVPWSRELEQKLGQHVAGVAREGGGIERGAWAASATSASKPRNLQEEDLAMSATKILWGQITIVFLIVLAGDLGARRSDVAWQLGFQAQLGAPGSGSSDCRSISRRPSSAGGSPTTPMRQSIFNEGAFIAASGGFLSIAVAIGMSVWRAREVKNVETYGSARWAEQEEVSGRRVCSAPMASCSAGSSATICATTAPSMSCASPRPVRARASAWSCRRC